MASDALAALVEREAALARDALRIEEERKALQRQILAHATEQSAAPRAKAARVAQSLQERKPWRLLADVQAEYAAKRAEGKLLPFGAPGRKPRVYVDGCFDMMHSGHFNAVRQAKLLADQVGGTLVVGVHSDAEILVNKGPPVTNDEERLSVVSAVKWVDELIFDTPYSLTLSFLDSIDADFCVHGDDISINADGTDAYADAKAAGRMKIVKRTEGVSTTDIVGRLLLLTRSPHTLSGSTLQAAPAADAPAEMTAAAAGSNPTGVEYVGKNISSSGVSQFLPTTWRLRQFSNGRTPAPGERVVYIDGAFDILHAGHVESLLEARQLGDFLLVGVHDDKTVSALKGPQQPVMSLLERSLSLLSLCCVDDIIMGAPYHLSPDLLRTMNISAVVRSPDDTGLSGGGLDRYKNAEELGLLHEKTDRELLTLDKIVQRIIQNRERFEARNAKREVKELNYVQNQKKYLPEL